MKSLTKLSISAGMIILASQAIAREPLPVELNGRNFPISMGRIDAKPVALANLTSTTSVQPAVETVLGRASVIPVSSTGSIVSQRVMAAGSGRPAVEIVFGRGGVIPVSTDDIVRAAEYQQGS